MADAAASNAADRAEIARTAIAAIWGGVDVIRDPYSDAASGGLRLTGLVTADVTVLRPAQLQVLTDLT